MNGVHGFLFQVYPYVCLAVFLLGSLIRFDQNQYSWKSDSSQLLRAGVLRWGSNLFHFGILFLFFGHLVGLFTPHSVYGMTIFLLFPFSRLVHVWSGFATVGFLFRPHQVVRSRRLSLPADHNQPRQPGAGV